MAPPTAAEEGCAMGSVTTSSVDGFGFAHPAVAGNADEPNPYFVLFRSPAITIKVKEVPAVGQSSAFKLIDVDA